MVHRFKSLWGALGIVGMSLYCRGVLALQADVYRGGVSGPRDHTVAAPAPVAPSAPAPAAAPTPIPGYDVPIDPSKITSKQLIIGSMAGVGRIFVLVAFFWLLIDVMRRLGGKRPAFKKPLILGGIGIIVAYIIPGIMR